MFYVLLGSYYKYGTYKCYRPIFLDHMVHIFEKNLQKSEQSNIVRHLRDIPRDTHVAKSQNMIPPSGREHEQYIPGEQVLTVANLFIL